LTLAAFTISFGVVDSDGQNGFQKYFENRK